MTASPRRLATAASAALLLAGCFASPASPSPSSTVAPEPAPSDSAAATVVPSAESPGTDPTVEPVPSDELGPFTCDLPIVEGATTARANIVDVRVGSHADYDRVVFEFDDGLPDMTLDRATPPFTQDASGLPMEVEGDSYVRLTMRGGTKQMEDGTSSYEGSTDFDPGFPTLVDLVEGGDFEAQSTWYLGLTSEACVRVLTLTDDGAPRLVIDVER
jgi:hypothetical protein